MFKTCKKPPMSIISASGSICSFNALQEGLPLKSHVVEVVATQSGSGTPSPFNPRPITGYSAINIGNSIAYDTNIEQGTLDSRGLNANATNRIRTADYIPVVSGHTYKITLIGSGAYYLGVSGYTANDYTTARTQSTAWLGNNTDLLIDAGVNYIRINVRFASSTDITPADLTGILVTDITNYHTIQIGSTIYGGEYDARTGLLTVTHELLTITNVDSVGTQGNLYFFRKGLTATQQSVNMTADNLGNYISETYYPALNHSAAGTFFVTSLGSSLHLTPIDQTLDTVAKMNTYLADNPAVCLIPLAESLRQTIQLPPCPIDARFGLNNIFADCGSTTLEAIKIGR